MQKFLDHIIRHSGLLEAESEVDTQPSKGSQPLEGYTGQVLFLFPNRRAGLHFKKRLAEQLDRPVWAPAVMSLGDFIKRQYKHTIADNLTLVFELFTVYQQTVESASEETFDSFYPWGNMMLRDFDEIDRYLVNARHVFTNVRDLHAIEERFRPELSDYEAFSEFWQTFSNEPITNMQSRFAEIWQKMGKVYYAFREHLAEKRLAYEGMAYQQLAQELDWTEKLPYEKVYCCGFNAMATAELRIFKKLLALDKAEMLWDVDQWYLNNRKHEAGHFLRQNFKHHFPQPDPEWLENRLATDAKQVETIGVPLRTGQAQVAAHRVRELMKDRHFDPEDTVIVLPDEQLLFPLLYALPPELKQFNITMGYPLKHSFTYSFVEALLEMHMESKGKGDNRQYNHRHVVKLLGHPFIEVNGPEAADALAQRIQAENVVFPKADWLRTEQPKLLQLLFEPFDQTADLLSHLRKLLLLISRGLEENEQSSMPMEQEFLLQFFKLLQRLDDLVGQYDIDLSTDMLYRLIDQMATTNSLPFTGEPLKGLQIMGLLETRALDFKNVILLSANEGLLPATNPMHSYIPYHIRQGFGMPTFDQQDGLFAYNFYRLLQRADNITIVYDTTVGKMSEGELSRFLKQIEYELAEANSNLQFRKTTANIPPRFTEPREITIPKDPQAMQVLERYTETGDRYLSPSTLATYITCPLQFYFSKILGLKETEELEEDVDAKKLGDIFHEAMQDLYQEKMGRPLSKEDYDHFRQQLEGKLTEKYRKEYSRAMERPEGKNVLNYHFLKTSAEKLFKIEEQEDNLSITAVETDKFEIPVPIEVDGTKKSIRLNGYFDRLDDRNGMPRIVDYKTGSKVELNSKAIANPEMLFDNADKKANLQGLIYALLYLTHYPNSKVEVGFYHLKELNKGMKMVSEEPLAKADLKPFEELLMEKIAEIYDPSVPFTQTEHVKNCEYCPFAGICER